MEGHYGNENSVQSISHQLERITQTSFSYSNQRQLFSLLLEHNSKIQNVLEAQNILFNSFFPYQTHQTTDSQHLEEQFVSQLSLNFLQSKSQLLKDINLSLQYHQNQITNYQREISKNSDIFKQINSHNEKERLKITKTKKNQAKTLHECFDSNKQEEQAVKWFVERLYNFATSNQILAQKMLEKLNLDYRGMDKLLKALREEASNMNKLRKFWKEGKNEFGRFFRIVSNTYLRRGYLEQGFRNKGKLSKMHLKLRRVLMAEIRR